MPFLTFTCTFFFLLRLCDLEFFCLSGNKNTAPLFFFRIALPSLGEVEIELSRTTQNNQNRSVNND